ncbi:MAG: trehalase family glycosidase [Bdellovibrionota bacterium]
MKAKPSAAYEWLMVAIALGFVGSASFMPALSAAAVPSRWVNGYEAVGQQLEKNLQEPSRRNPYRHAHPAPKYSGVYLWDSAFIALVWSHRDVSVAKDVIRSVLHNQRADGHVPHAVTIFSTSKLTQPPVLTWAAARIAHHANDVAFASEIYAKLKRYNEWLFANRRLKTGLFFWEHAYESGIDNAPRFGARDESYYIDTRGVESIDLSSYVVMDCEALASLATMIASSTPAGLARDGYLRDEARFTTCASEVGQLVRDRLWDETTGYFYDRTLSTGKFIAIPTIASVLPLTAGIASPEQATRLMSHLMNPKQFNTPIPFPSVSRSSPHFEKDMWRGPVWINTAYLAIQGMKRYGRASEAREMSSRLVDGVYSAWHYTGKFVEFYDPEAYDFRALTRKKGLGPLGLSRSKDIRKILMHLIGKQIYLGTKPVSRFVGWTGLVNNLVIEDQLTPPPNAPPLRHK